jgi:hypothetical protein
MYIEPFDKKIVSYPEYSKIMVENEKKKLFKIGLYDETPIYTDDCFSKCDQQKCQIMYEKKKNLDKCLKCNSEKKCFRKSIIGGNCNDCLKDEKQIDCYNINNFGCTNPDDLNSLRGTDPYFIQIPDNNNNSPFDKKCVFCWNIFDNL